MPRGEVPALVLTLIAVLIRDRGGWERCRRHDRRDGDIRPVESLRILLHALRRHMFLRGSQRKTTNWMNHLAFAPASRRPLLRTTKGPHSRKSPQHSMRSIGCKWPLIVPRCENFIFCFRSMALASSVASLANESCTRASGACFRKPEAEERTGAPFVGTVIALIGSRPTRTNLTLSKPHATCYTLA